MSTELTVTDVKLIARYGITPEQIAATKAEYAALTCDTREGYEQVRTAIATLRAKRGEVETKRKELKAGALEYGRKVDTIAHDLTAMIEEIEEPLKEKKAAVDEAKARAKAEKEAAEKAALEAQLRAEREAEEARLRAEREAEEARLAAVAESQRVEAERLAQERRAFEEEQRAAKEAADKAAAEAAAALAAERVKLDADRKAEESRQRVAREQEESRLAAVRVEEEAKLDAAKAEQDAARKLEQQKIEAERAALDLQRKETERLEADRLARIEAERLAEVRRVEIEEATVRERERQAALKARAEVLRPDADKLRTWAEQLMHVPPPEVSSDEARAAIADVGKMLEGVVERLKAFDRPADVALSARTLVVTIEEDDDSDYAAIRGEIDGKEIFDGSYGGEPEDNSRTRHYSWVQDAIEAVAEVGGLIVEYRNPLAQEAAE